MLSVEGWSSVCVSEVAWSIETSRNEIESGDEDLWMGNKRVD